MSGLYLVIGNEIALSNKELLTKAINETFFEAGKLKKGKKVEYLSEEQIGKFLQSDLVEVIKPEDLVEVKENNGRKINSNALTLNGFKEEGDSLLLSMDINLGQIFPADPMWKMKNKEGEDQQRHAHRLVRSAATPKDGCLTLSGEQQEAISKFMAANAHWERDSVGRLKIQSRESVKASGEEWQGADLFGVQLEQEYPGLILVKISGPFAPTNPLGTEWYGVSDLFMIGVKFVSSRGELNDKVLGSGTDYQKWAKPDTTPGKGYVVPKSTATPPSATDSAAEETVVDDWLARIG